MGHKIADVDSFGAAVGIYRAALTMEKKAYIVLNDITSSVRPLYQSFCESPLYPDDMFIRSEDVDEIINDSTVEMCIRDSSGYSRSRERLDCKDKTLYHCGKRAEERNSKRNPYIS